MRRVSRSLIPQVAGGLLAIGWLKLPAVVFPAASLLFEHSRRRAGYS